MQQLVLKINNLKNIHKIIKLIEHFNFIETIEISNSVTILKKTKTESLLSINKLEDKFNSIDEMMECFGIWKDRDITKESLRKKAWRTYEW